MERSLGSVLRSLNLVLADLRTEENTVLLPEFILGNKSLDVVFVNMVLQSIEAYHPSPSLYIYKSKHFSVIMSKKRKF